MPLSRQKLFRVFLIGRREDFRRICRGFRHLRVHVNGGAVIREFVGVGLPRRSYAPAILRRKPTDPDGPYLVRQIECNICLFFCHYPP